MNHEARVPMQSDGADLSVGAMMAGNAAGAKGQGQAVVFRSSTGNRRRLA